jgi:uncharacterized membrane protein
MFTGVLMGQFCLTRPAWLWALAVLPVLLYYWRRTLVRHSLRRRIASLAVRVVLLVVAALALSGPKMIVPSAEDHVAIVVGSSPAVPGESHAIGSYFRKVANEAGCQTTEVAIEDLGKMEGGRRPLGRTGDPAAAIAIARASIPAGRVGRIVLISDGPFRDEVILAADAAGVPISTVPLSRPTEVYMAAVTAPAQVQRGAPFDLDAVVQSNHEDDGTLRVSRGTQVIQTRKVNLAAGENRFRFPLVLAEGSAALFTVRIDDCADQTPENNAADCVVMVGPPPRVLVIESQPGLAAHLRKALEPQQIEVEIRSPEAMPSRTEDLRQFDLVILANVPAAALPAERMQALGSYVRDAGGGLIAVGGQQAFTAGGYRGTPLEDALPVISEVKRAKPKPSLAMVLVLDVSGSMEGNSISLAKEAIHRAVDMLTPRDQVGVLAFEDESRWVVPLGPVTDTNKIMAQVRVLGAGGGTTMYPAIERAYLALREAHADLKHILVMTDGISNPGDFDALAKQVAAAGITMSTVGVGDEPARPLLQRIADVAKGHAYFCDDAAALPKIFAIETGIAAKIGITEEPFFPKVVHAAPAIGGLDFAHVPTLLGYVETQARPESQVVLAAPAGEPILALGRYGLGATAAFTSDIQSRWAAAWLGWDGFEPFWVQLVRQTMRKDPMRNTRLRADYSGGRIHVTWDVVDPAGQYVNGAEATASILDPKGSRREVPLAQVAPGRYAASLEAAAMGPYYLEGKLRYQGRPVATERLGIVVPYPDELRIRPVNVDLLRAIAERTGGRYDPTPEEAMAPDGRTVPRTFWLWPWLLGAAMVGLVLDVAIKRAGGAKPRAATPATQSRGFPQSPIPNPQSLIPFPMKRIVISLLAIFCAAASGAEAPRPLGWRPAPAAAVAPEPGADAAGPSLDEIAKAAASAPPAGPPRKTPPTVVPRETYPLAYRTILLRYFAAPRSKE